MPQEGLRRHSANLLHMGAKLALQKWRAIPMKDRGGGDEREQTKRFTDEFKRKAIRLTMTSGRSIERVAN
jgi:hypothetical protein